jgi:tRNA-specific 2-thiouridylase
VPSGNYVKFIAAYLGERGESLSEEEGDLVTTSGEVIGRHRGVHNYTVGQRKGLGIAAGKPLYVVELDRAANRVIVGDDSDLRTNVCEICDVNWISFAALESPVRATVKIRHRHEPAAATIEPIDATSARVTFDEPQRAITPGQAAVCYSGDVVLGGGWIR